MKVSPLAVGGQPGAAIGSAEVGRTADPTKMARARAIARGEKVEDQPPAQEPRQRVDLQKIRMHTQRSTHRDEIPVEPEVTPEVPAAPQQELSSTPESNEQGNVEATQPLSPQFAALAKQKRALQVKERELQEREAKLAGQPNTEDRDKLIERIKSQPLSVLLENGVTYDQLTEAILNGGQQYNPEIQALKEELKALKEGVDKSFQTREQQQEESALTEMLYEAEALAKEGEDFALIREQDAYEQVLRLIHSTYKKSGRVLDVREAMEQIENKLLVDAEKLAKLQKVQGRLAPPPPQQLQPQQRQMRTLTARDVATPAMTARQRAIAAFQGTLKR